MSNVLQPSSLHYLESLYLQYLQNPNAVSKDWQKYFSTLQAPMQNVASTNVSAQNVAAQNVKSDPFKPKTIDKNMKVRELVDAYRLLGHLHAKLDPLQLRQISLVPELMLSYYRLEASDLNTVFAIDTLNGGQKTLKQILELLQKNLL